MVFQICLGLGTGRPKRKLARLHYIGAGTCPLVPGVDYYDFVECGLVQPSSVRYDLLCRRCWAPDRKATKSGGGVGSSAVVGTAGGESSSSADESSSSAGVSSSSEGPSS